MKDSEAERRKAMAGAALASGRLEEQWREMDSDDDEVMNAAMHMMIASLGIMATGDDDIMPTARQTVFACLGLAAMYAALYFPQPDQDRIEAYCRNLFTAMHRERRRVRAEYQGPGHTS